MVRGLKVVEKGSNSNRRKKKAFKHQAAISIFTWHFTLVTTKKCNQSPAPTTCIFFPTHYTKASTIATSTEKPSMHAVGRAQVCQTPDILLKNKASCLRSLRHACRQMQPRKKSLRGSLQKGSALNVEDDYSKWEISTPFWEMHMVGWHLLAHMKHFWMRTHTQWRWKNRTTSHPCTVWCTVWCTDGLVAWRKANGSEAPQQSQRKTHHWLHASQNWRPPYYGALKLPFGAAAKMRNWKSSHMTGRMTVAQEKIYQSENIATKGHCCIKGQRLAGRWPSIQKHSVSQIVPSLLS